MTIALSLLAAVALAAHPTAGTLADAPSASAPVPFTVAVADSFGDPRLLGVGRRTVGPRRLDMIIVKRSALTPAFLVALANAMSESYRRHGATPLEQVNMYFMRKRTWPEPNAAQLAWAERVIAQLSVASRRDLPRIGFQPSVDAVFEAP